MLRRSAALLAFVASITLLLAACVPGSEDVTAAAQPADGATESLVESDAAGPSGGESPAESAAEPPGPPPLAEEITLPPGIVAVRWAEGLAQPVAIAFDSAGRLLVAERGGRVWLLQDSDGDGLADAPTLFADGLGELRGIAVGAEGQVYLSERGRVSRALDADGDGVAELVSPLLRGLPGGSHPNGGVAAGPDGRLYVGVGSTCNDCAERDPLAASVLVFDPKTARVEVYASGLRNPAGLAFNPEGQLWATDQGSLSPCVTPDELNRIVQGADYGWPYCAADATALPGAGPPAVRLGVETGASGLAWFESPLFAEEFRRGLFIALSTRPRPTSHHETDPAAPSVQFLRVREDGSLTLRQFAAGFREPIDVAAGPDSGVYVADAEAGVIYRIGAPFDD